MSRSEAFQNYIDRNRGVNLIESNIAPIYNNLVLAEKDNKLVEFLLNKKPYQSRMRFFANRQLRGCDQCALICALNIYGSQNPGFARRLHQAYFVASNDSLKQAQELNLILNWQMHLQAADASLINFADTALITHINNKIRKRKGWKIAMWCLLLCGGAIGAPGSAMIGLIPLTLVCAALIVLSFCKGFSWIMTPVKSPEAIQLLAREVSDELE